MGRKGLINLTTRTSAQDPESRRKALQALAAEDTYVRALIIGQLDAEFLTREWQIALTAHCTVFSL